MVKNVIVAQSGGPSAVINNSLRGIIESCKKYPDIFGEIYGGWHGIEGVLKEELINLSLQPDEEIKYLKNTPAAGSIGTCRYKLKDNQKEDYERILDVFMTHNIGYFFYIGGNDSQHTVLKISELARSKGIDLIATGVPKTIDNDLGDDNFRLIDHTPGYGSVARYWSHIIQNANEENMGSFPADPVLVLQAMGRRIGFIPAASRLADPDRSVPMLICLPESGLTMNEIADRVNETLIKSRRCLVVVSEGLNFGEIGVEKDAFGHTSFGSTKITVSQILINYLNANGLRARGSARGQVMGTDQRSSAIYASITDLEEAYNVAQKAVEIAIKEGNGWMATLLREPGRNYSVRYDKVSLEKVALSERTFPKKWIATNGFDVTDEFLDYAHPLLGEEWPEIPLENGLQRFARLKKVFVEKKLEQYVPQGYRCN